MSSLLQVSSLAARLVLLSVLVSAVCAATAVWGGTPGTTVEIVEVRPLVADWCEEGEYLEVDVRVRLTRGAQNWCSSEEESWLEVERRVAGEWERECFPICAYGYREVQLPGGSEVIWTEWVALDPMEEREMRFVLDVPCPKRLGLFGGRLFAASEPFRPSKLLSR